MKAAKRRRRYVIESSAECIMWILESGCGGGDGAGSTWEALRTGETWENPIHCQMIRFE